MDPEITIALVKRSKLAKHKKEKKILQTPSLKLNNNSPMTRLLTDLQLQVFLIYKQFTNFSIPK